MIKRLAPLRLLTSLILVVLISLLFGVSVDAARDKERPTVPTDLHVITQTDTTISIGWTESTDNVGVAAYYIYMNNVLGGTSPTSTYTATGLIPETTYSFYVIAKDSTGNPSPKSNTISVTTDAATPPPSIPYRVVAYYTSWSAYNGYTPDKIPYDKVTHINYAFANIGNDLKIALGDATIDLKNFEKLRALKKFNPNLKTLISVGGWSWSGKFSDVALTETSRAAFADSCVKFITDYGFDGVDIDWEYPVSGGMSTNTTRPEDKHNFTLLLEALRSALGDNKLLTIAGGAGPSFAANTELGTLIQSLSFANIMTYDIHGGWDKYTDFNAPLKPDTASPNSQWSVDQAVNLWLDAGVPADKIVVGIPFYGKKYGSVKSTNNYAPAYPGLYQTYGRCTTVTYQEIVKNYLSNTNYKYRFHEIAQVPYLFDGATFISYDDKDAIAAKTQYITSSTPTKGALGGAMVWELSQDNNNELINKIYDGLSTLP